MTDSLATKPARRALEDALAFGEKIDVTGDSIHYLPMPVFLTRAVWKAVRRTAKLDVIEFTVTLRMRRFPRWTTLRLKAVATPDANGKCAFITVMLPKED